MAEHQLIKDLANGFSTQAKQSNQYWLFLMLTSIISLANIEKAKNNELVELPFQLGKVIYQDFNSFVLIMICAASIAFASAFLQGQRILALVQKVIDKTPSNDRYIEGIHVKDVFDSIISPTFNRVAPVSQFIKGNARFHGDALPNKINIVVGTVAYFLLKLTTFLIVFLIPLLALYKNFILFSNINAASSWGIPYFIYWFVCLISLSVFIIIVASDILWVVKSLKRLWN